MKFYLNAWVLVSLSFILLASCQPSSDTGDHTEALTSGLWRGEIQLEGGASPFFLKIKQADTLYSAQLINGGETFDLPDVRKVQDSLYIDMHSMGTTLEAKIINPKEIQGAWVKHDYAEPYRMPFRAEYGNIVQFRYEIETEPLDVSGKWSTTFTESDGSTYPAIGVFKQANQEVQGTFITPTGDYRYLSGFVEGKELTLSSFDGGSVFYFKAQTTDGDSLQGEFWSGKSSYETFSAYRDEGASLPNPDSLTFLKDGYDRVYFGFPNLDGDSLSLDDAKYQDKVVILQLFGSWCHNCMDETAFLAPYYAQNKDRGLEIIGLAYERSPNFEKARDRVKKMISRYDIQYDFTIAGINDKQKAAETLPMLNHVMSFPTTIFIDRKGEVRRIHTGFYGPSTGVYYEKFVREFRQFMDRLLDEEV